VTVADLLSRELRRDGARPLVTWYDHASGDRVELSVATAANWAAKIAGHLVEEYDAEPGVSVRVATPLHWTSAVVLLGVWCTGAAVSFDDADVVFEVDADPLGMSLSGVVGAQPDVFAPGALDPDALALRIAGREWRHRTLADAATDAAAQHQVDRSARVLSTLALDTIDGLDAGLLMPLAAGASVVLVANADQARLSETATTERATHSAGSAVDGLARLGQ
jgi:hypothetical protein